MVFSRLQLSERNLVLTGYVEPNKPRIGRQVAQRLNKSFVDVSARIEGQLGDDIDTLRAIYGERHLKTVEAEIMEEVLLRRGAVIRVNGSTLMHSDHYAALQQTSIMVCLVARLDSILQRLHMTLGARYHNPAERGAELGHLRREWAVRQRDNLHELDMTYKSEAAMVDDIVGLWQNLAVQRA